MSGVLPSLVTAPRVLLQVGNDIVAYAIGLNFNISVDVRPVPSLGMYAPAGYEPVMCQPITGSIQIVKLVNKNSRDKIMKSAAEADLNNEKTLVDQASDNFQNVADSFAKQQQNQANPQNDNSILKLPTGVAKDSDMIADHLDPNNILLANTFDMDIILNLTGKSADQKTIFKISDCRITGRSVNIALGQLLGEVVSFNGLLVVATPSSGIKAPANTVANVADVRGT
jgi:hypothetical protein